MYYKIVERRNIGADKKQYPTKFYAQSFFLKEQGLSDNFKSLEKDCTFTESEIVGIVSALVKEIKEGLVNGKKVVIDKLGTFKLSARSTGAVSVEEFTSSNLKTPGLLFRPSKELNETRELVSLERVPDSLLPAEDEQLDEDEE